MTLINALFTSVAPAGLLIWIGNRIRTSAPQEEAGMHYPFIIPQQDWCCQGDRDDYRFGYDYRQSFSSPTSIKVCSSTGQPPDSDWAACQREADKYPTP